MITRGTRILYNVCPAAVVFLFYHFILYFLERGKKPILLVHSESVARKLEVEYETSFEKK